MTRNTTKRALVMSMISLILCVSMLAGSTFAWFTDTASTGVNKITSGNLDLVLEYLDKDGNWSEASESTLLFDDGALWEPGHTEVAYIKVTNNGSLALKYELAVNVYDEVAGVNVAGEPFKLSEVLKFGKIVSKTEIAEYEKREDAIAAAEEAGTVGNLSTFGKNEVLASGESTYIALVVYMPTTTDNGANHNGVNIPEIKLGVSVVATQANVEDDSFGNDYDKLVDDFSQLTGEAAKELYGTVAISGFNIKPTDFANGEFKIGDFANFAASNVDTLVLDGGYITTGESNDGLDYAVPGISINAPEGTTVIIKNATISGAFYVNVPYPEYPHSKSNVSDIVFENCVINGTWMGYPNAFESVTFNNCVFTNSGMDLESMYTANCFPVWFACQSDTEVNFQGCTFEGNRGIHLDGRNATVTANIEGCTFNLKPGAASNEDISKITAFKFLGTVNATLKDNIINSATSKFDISGANVTVNESGTTVAEGIFENRSDVKYAKDDAALKTILSGDLSNVKAILLGKGTFTPVNLNYCKVDIIGSIDANGNPTTKFYAETAPEKGNDNGIWAAYEGNVSNVIFEAADGVANNNIEYGAFSLNHTDFAEKAYATFTNCQFINQGIKFNGDVDFIDCVFDGKGTAGKAFNYCIADGDILVDGCTFTGYTGVAINIAESPAATLTVKNSTINSLVELGALASFTVDENTTLNCNVIAWFTATTVTIPEGSFGEGYSYTNYNN